MKALKIVLGIIAAIIAIYLVLCLVGPKESVMDVSRSAEMSAPASLAYQQVANVTNWEKWLPWKEADPSMKMTYGEPTEGVGANYTWTSDKSGDGSLKIVEAVPNESVKTEIAFSDWAGPPSSGFWTFEGAGEGKTNVTWGMKSNSPLPFMMRGMMLFMDMEAMVGKDFEKGLAALKTYVEEEASKLPTSYRGHEVKEVDFPGVNYATIRNTINMADMQTFFASNYATILGEMGKHDVEMAGMPCALYYQWDEATGTTDLAAAIPASQVAEYGAGVQNTEVKAGKSLVIDYQGGYSGLGNAHYAMDDYMKDRGIESELVIEEYVTDPQTEPDSTKWLTRIHYVLGE